jgi:3-hydroxyisobutyrate dehydrogenase
VLFGEKGVAFSMPEGAVFISSATMDPAACKRLATRLEAAGRLYLDAPISGGAARAATAL